MSPPAPIPALVPAAGRSRRMGRPKLTLPLGGSSIIARVVAALRGGGAYPVVVVVPPPDQPGAAELAAQARESGARVVACAAPTADMRATVERGLPELPPCPGLLLCPGDSPGITPALVARVLAAFAADPSRLVIPAHAGRRGHPVALPWDLAATIPGLPAGVGINALRADHADRVVLLDVAEPGAVADLDTPEDYRLWGGFDDAGGRTAV